MKHISNDNGHPLRTLWVSWTRYFGETQPSIVSIIRVIREHLEDMCVDGNGLDDLLQVLRLVKHWWVVILIHQSNVHLK